MVADATLTAMRENLVSIKGPLTTPVGGGIRSLNVALRQKLDLFACVRTSAVVSRTPSPVKEPDSANMIILRENSEDVYAGIEWESGSEGAAKLIQFLKEEIEVDKIRFPNTSGIDALSQLVSKEQTGNCTLCNKLCYSKQHAQRHTCAQKIS